MALGSAIIARFVENFYPGPLHDTPFGSVLGITRRRDDVLRQLAASLTARGTKLDKETVVRAYDLEHLEACCAQLKPGDVRQRDKAIHLLLLKLRDTWAETKALREKPPEIPRRRELPTGSPTSIKDMIKQQRALA